MILRRVCAHAPEAEKRSARSAAPKKKMTHGLRRRSEKKGTGNRLSSAAPKSELQPELHTPGTVDGGIDFPERAGSIEVAARQSKLRMVEQVEDFRAEIEAGIFPGQRKALDHREVGVDEVRSVNRSAVGISELTSRRLRETVDIEPLVDALADAVIRIANLIRTSNT